jgi:ubiquinone/menaquinone biosynthesis C-methylase UbiE
MAVRKYIFEDVVQCEICRKDTSGDKILGQRMDKSQGMSPKKKTGITVSIKKCRNCGLIYSSPQPIPFDIQNHYGIEPEDYWGDDYVNYDPAYFKRQIDNAKELLPFSPGMKVLDIGAGLGKAMKSMENAGFSVYGIEPSNTFHKKALEWMGYTEEQLKLGMVEDIDFPEASFDFITMGAVFEHLYHPAAVLERLVHWLKPGGLIHIEVPSAKWLIPKLVNIYYRLRGTNYVTNLSPMHAPFHLYEYSLESFEEACKRYNLELTRHYVDVCSVYFVPSFLKPLFRKIMEWTGTGMQLTVYMRKKN